MTHIPTYEEACAAKNAGAEQPQMAAGQYWYNQFGVLWRIVAADKRIIARKAGTSDLRVVELENYDSVIYAGYSLVRSENDFEVCLFKNIKKRIEK